MEKTVRFLLNQERDRVQTMLELCGGNADQAGVDECKKVLELIESLKSQPDNQD